MTISLTEFRLLQKLAGTSTTSSGSLTAANNLSDLTNVATARTNLGLGTAATTAASAYATSAQGTDERVPTSAGLTTKFGTNKASLVDGDKVLILDSAASGAPKHGLWSLVKSTLKTYFDTLYPSGSGTSSGTNTGDNAVNSSSATAAQGTTADNALPKAGGTLTGSLTATAINASLPITVSRGTAGVGTVSVAVGTPTIVTGVGTDFLSRFNVGDTITISGQAVKTISVITSDTQLTVSVTYGGAVASTTYTHTSASAIMNPSGAISGSRLLVNTGGLITYAASGFRSNPTLTFNSSSAFVRAAAYGIMDSNFINGMGDCGFAGSQRFVSASTSGYAWTSGTTITTGSIDTGIYRNAAGVVEINNGTAGTFQDLKLRALDATTTIKTGGYTVATLPTAAVGMRCYVTNALAPTYAAAVVGGGAVTIPVFYNGTAWICA